MNGLTSVKALLDYEQFTKFGPILLKIDNIEKELKQIILSIKGYYKKYGSKQITVDELETYFRYQNPSLPNPEMYDLLFTKLREIKIENPELLIDILHQFVELHYMTKISQKANEVIQEVTPTAVAEIDQLIAELNELTGGIQDAEMDVCNLSLAELLEMDTSEGLNWRLDFLNRVFGPLKTATLGHIFARPDSGKTSLALSEITFFVSQMKQSQRPLLYLNNEEAITRLKLRGYNSLLGVSSKWLLGNMPQAQQLWKENGGDQIKFIGGVNFLDQVEKYLEAYHPRVCIIDQGPKLSCPMKGDDNVRRLQKIYNTLRGWAKDYDCSIITLGQADNASENQKFLHLNNLDSSKVAIPGELDWCLGIGNVHEVGQEEVRYLNCCKNKLSGMYGNDMVHFDVHRCRFKHFEEN